MGPILGPFGVCVGSTPRADSDSCPDPSGPDFLTPGTDLDVSLGPHAGPMLAPYWRPSGVLRRPWAFLDRSAGHLGPNVDQHGKTDKKRLWFDFIKILTCLKSDTNGKGLIICPKNYAHSNGVWDLFEEAQSYKHHLERVFDKHSDVLKRVFIIGYEQQYKEHDGEKFVRYTSLHYKKIKDSQKE